MVECDNDELLLLTLGLPRKQLLHQGNREEVVKYILKHESGRFIGLVDEDPGTVRSKQRAAFAKGKSHVGLRTEKAGRRVLTVICPFLEGWLVAAVHACGGRMEKLDKGLSDDPRELHRQLSPRGDMRMHKIIAFLEKKNSMHLQVLRTALQLEKPPLPHNSSRPKKV